MSITLRNITGEQNLTFRNTSGSGTTAFSIFDNRPFAQIDTIISYLRKNTSDIKNPDFFTYFLDGDEYYIEEGGGTDMYDRGSYTAPWLLSETDYTSLFSIPAPTPCLNYSSQSATVVDTNFYYASIGYTQSFGLWPNGYQSDAYHPRTLIGARSGSGPIGFQKAGNIGADGSGSIESKTLYSGSNLNGFTTYAFYRQTYGAHECPAICDLYLLIGHPKWESQFDIIVSSSNPDTNYNGSAFYATGESKNLLAITTLLSKEHMNMEVTDAEVNTVVNNYTILLKEALKY